MKRIWVLSMFDNYFDSFKELGIIGSVFRGERNYSLELNTVRISDFSEKDFKGVDAAPYGGGEGMVMRADILKKALLEGVVQKGDYGDNFREKLHIIYPSPRGKQWSSKVAKDIACNYLAETSKKDLVFICGRYEGIDERFIENYVDEQYSLGDYILTGAEIAVMAMIDSSMRFIPGVLGNKLSAHHESFENDLLEHPQYTRPMSFEGKEVPKVLLSGHHEKIEEFRFKQREELTQKYRPDLGEKKE